MRRVLRWSMVVLLPVQIVLVFLDVLSPAQALAITIAVEVLVVVSLSGRLFFGLRAFRAHRRQAESAWDAYERAVHDVMPPPVSHVFVAETRVFYVIGHGLATLLRRRPVPGFKYTSGSIAPGLIFVMLLTAPAEILLFEVLIPWAWLRAILLLASLYGLLWVIAFGMSLWLLRHEVKDDVLILRFALFHELRVPLRAIEHVEVLEKPHREERSEGFSVVGETAILPIGSMTRAVLRLDAPVTGRQFWRESPPVTEVRFSADRITDLVAAVRAASDKRQVVS